MKKLFLTLLVLTTLFSFANGQTDFVVPDYAFVSREDYENYEDEIIEASKWLDATPLENEKEKRKEVEKFVLTWVLGSSSVTLSLSGKMIDYTKKNDLLVTFIGSYSRYVLEHKSAPDETAALTAALTSIMNVYEMSKSRKKEPLIEKLIKNKSDISKYAGELLVK